MSSRNSLIRCEGLGELIHVNDAALDQIRRISACVVAPCVRKRRVARHASRASCTISVSSPAAIPVAEIRLNIRGA